MLLTLCRYFRITFCVFSAIYLCFTYFLLISQIYPSRVPVDGGSLVTISGTNLGYDFTMVRVQVNGIEVRGVPTGYETSKRLVNTLSQA